MMAPLKKSISPSGKRDQRCGAQKHHRPGERISNKSLCTTGGFPEGGEGYNRKKNHWRKDARPTKRRDCKGWSNVVLKG